MSSKRSFLHLGDSSLSTTPTAKDPVDVLTKKAILSRIILFGLLETAFIALSASVLIKPIILYLPSHVTLSEAKGAFTVISIIWHALAAMVVKDILLFVFSSEWLAQYEQTGLLESGSTDRVSKLTAGFPNRAHHFLSKAATARYRAAMILTLLLTTIGVLGPSATAVITMSVDAPVEVSVANVSFPFGVKPGIDFKDDNTWVIESRANSILRMELFEKAPFGFQSSPGVMIPWPQKRASEENGGRIMYKSDVMSFNFSCSWRKPTFQNFTSWDGGSIFWRLENLTFVGPSLDGDSGLLLLGSWPSTFLGAFLMFVDNDRNASQPDVPTLNLTGLPVSNRDEIREQAQGTGLILPQTAQSVTALICDPQVKVYPADVTLENGLLSSTPIDHPLIGNIDSHSTIRAQFTGRLVPDMALNFPDSVFGVTSSGFNSISRLLFFCTEEDRCDTSVKPFPIPVINDNMNRFFASASKAFFDGYNGTRPGVGTLSIPNFNTFSTEAVGRVEKMALVASRPFFISLVVTLALTALLLGILFLLVKPEELLCFNLDNISHSLLSERLDLSHSPTSIPIPSHELANISASSVNYFCCHSCQKSL